jgi:hypothetical protein
LSVRYDWLETLEASGKESEENRANGQSGLAFLLQSRTILESRLYGSHYPCPKLKIYHSNGNNNWKDSEAMEMKHLAEYKTFLDQGKDSMDPIGYKKIR